MPIQNRSRVVVFRRSPYFLRYVAQATFAIVWFAASGNAGLAAQEGQPRIPAVDLPPAPLMDAAASGNDRPAPSVAPKTDAQRWAEISAHLVQGEYLGWLELADGRRPYGLQVIATGGSSVAGQLLLDGLPGLLAPDYHATSLSGQWHADGLRLSSPDGLHFELRTQPELSFIQTSASGTVLAELKRIERRSATLGLAPPQGATVLFAEGLSEYLEDAKLTPAGNLDVGATTKFPVHQFRLHLEFKTPLQPEKKQEKRGNSGIYIQRRYEIQILDSFGMPPLFNHCGSVYRQRQPEINMSLPPQQWQTFDIWFTPAKFSAAGKKTTHARVTVHHNGVAIHRNVEVFNKTGAGKPEGPEALPLHFQNHGDPVEFRNVWIVR